MGVTPISIRAIYVLLAMSAVVLAGRSFASDCPDGDEAALAWLDRMSRSAREVNYQGVVTLQRGQDMKVMQVSHSVDEGSSWEVLTELTGEGAQVERGGHPLDCVHPGMQLLRTGSLGDTGHCGIAQQYRFSVAEGERIAGRNAVTIRVHPRDMYRFGYVFALDRDTGLLLKAQTVNRGSHILETMQFAQLSYADGGHAPASAEIVHQAEHPGPEASPKYPVTRSWNVEWLPRGFTPTDKPLGTSGRRTYTDGLAAFSVFLEVLAEEIRPGEGHVKQGGTTTYTRGMRLAGEPVLVTVIGEVPVNTARMVADSVSWVQ